MDELPPPDHTERPVRADAQRNLDALLQASKAVFAASGVDAPVLEIAEAAGVGIGTVYRHFPQRSNLIAAVFRASPTLHSAARGGAASAQASISPTTCRGPHDEESVYARRMVELLVDGLRYRANTRIDVTIC